MKNDKPLVSVIVTAYNAEKTLQKCIDSILNQNFDNYEIVLVNNGSTDSTGSICERYLPNDYIVYCKKDKNQSIADGRNLAMRNAKGKYVVIVDADDWIPENYLKLLSDKVEKENADLGVCDFIIVKTMEDDFEVRRSQDVSKCNKIELMDIEESFWAKIWKKNLFTSNGIEQPNQFCEDIATVPLLIAYAKKIVYVPNCFYYYTESPYSTTSNPNTLNDRVKAIRILVEEYKKRGLFDEKKEELKAFCKYRVSANMNKIQAIHQAEREKYKEDNESILQEYFEDTLEEKKRIEIIGSYNGFRMAHDYGRSIILSRNMSSSFVSMTMECIPAVEEVPINIDNSFKRWYVWNDCTKAFMHKNRPVTEPDVVLIDFLDERFDVGIEGNGAVTLSDAYYENEGAFTPETILKIMDRTELWEKACDIVIAKIHRIFPTSNIILTRFLLCEMYGHNGKEKCFDNIEEIRAVNRILNHYYDYFETKCHGVHVIDVADQDFYYTDESFRYGCYPWHLNENAYTMLIKILREKMEEVV